MNSQKMQPRASASSPDKTQRAAVLNEKMEQSLSCSIFH